MEIFTTIMMQLEASSLSIQIVAMVILLSLIQSSLTKLAMYMMD